MSDSHRSTRSHPNPIKSFLLLLLLTCFISITTASDSIKTTTATAISTPSMNELSLSSSSSNPSDFSSLCDPRIQFNSTHQPPNSTMEEYRHRKCYHNFLISHPNPAVEHSQVRLISVELVRVGVTYIILYSTLATLLFLMSALVLVRHGIKGKRNSKIAWVLGIALTLGLVGSVLTTVFWSMMLMGDYSSSERNNRLYLASLAILVITPLVAQVSLIFRLQSFYPPSLAQSFKRRAIVAVPIILTIARLGLITAYLVDALKAVKSKVEVGTEVPAELMFSEEVLGLVQLLYTSIALFRKFHHLGQGRSKELSQRNNFKILHSFKQILYGIAFTFAFPTAFQAGLVGASASSSVNGNQLGFILVANIYVQCFGAVLATLSISHRWRDQRFTPTDAKKEPRRRSSMSQIESGRDFLGGDGGGPRRISVPQTDLLLQTSTIPTVGVQAQINAHEERRERLADLEEFAATRSQGDLESGLLSIDNSNSSPRFIKVSKNGKRPDTGDSDTTNSNSNETYNKSPYSNTFDSDSSMSDRDLIINYSSSRRPSLPPLLDDAEVSPFSSPNLSGIPPLPPPQAQRRSVDVTLHPSSQDP